MKRGYLAVAAALLSCTAASVAYADCYDRTGWTAVMTVGAHNSQGIATIVDERTIRVDHFSYDDGAIIVYFYLGATEAHADFLAGIPIGPELHFNDDVTITVQLPEGQTLDGYGAIAVWCDAVNVSFTTATFQAPNCSGDLNADKLVDLTDLGVLLANYGMTGAIACDGDLDGSTTIDLTDLGMLLSEYGSTCTP